VSEKIIEVFENSLLGDICPVKKGADTADNNYFLRLWHELKFNKLGINQESSEEFTINNYKWAPYNKGGQSRKWYGNNDIFVLWENNGYELEKVFGIKAPMLSDVFDEEVWNFILEQKKQGKSVPQILCENGIPLYMLAEVDEYMESNPFDGQVDRTPANQYNPQILNYKGDIYYHGYWINKNWFATYRDEFLKIFTFPPITDEKNKKYMDSILNSNSCSIHIRRGDYVTLGWAMEIEHYRKLIEIYLLQRLQAVLSKD
jgi:hypothetical protein